MTGRNTCLTPALKLNQAPASWPRVTALFACLLWFGVPALLATPRYVVEPGTIENGKDVIPYNTWTNAATNIQWAVNVAAADETVWVNNGTYLLTNQISITKGITVRSVNGRGVTIVNGNYPAYSNRCFYATNGNALVQGFTITNGYITSGSGCGVYLQNGATVRDCLISGNTAKNCNGAGVYINTIGTVDVCSVVGNVSTGTVHGGGGVYCYAGGTVTNSTIAYNLAIITADGGYSGGGGGVLLNGGGVVQNCAIATNNYYQTQWGGGAGVNFCAGGQAINSIVIGNSNLNDGVTRGGGVWIYYGGTLQGCLITGNKSTISGSGVGMNIGLPTIIRNCTIVGNGGSSGLDNYGNTTGSLLVDNCIIVSNYDYPGTALRNWSIGNIRTNSSFTNCCTDPTNFTAGVQSSGCISNYPAFVSYSAGNYRLTSRSPCVNTGTNQSWMLGAVDLDGRMRIRYGTVDMGAYERINEGAVFGFH